MYKQRKIWEFPLSKIVSSYAYVSMCSILQISELRGAKEQLESKVKSLDYYLD